MAILSKIIGSFEDMKTIDNTKPRSKIKALLLADTSAMWKSKLSWKIIAYVFLTILIVQAPILYSEIEKFKTTEYSNLKKIARASIAPILKTNNISALSSPFEKTDVTNLINRTPIRGVAIYSPDIMLKSNKDRLTFIEAHGTPITTTVRTLDDINRTYKSPNGTSYEMVFNSVDLGIPSTYAIIISMDSSHIAKKIQQFYWNSLFVVALLAGLVTAVLMITLWILLLEPMLFMRENLIEASKNPENPNIENPPFNKDDEIGEAITLTQNLIRQNATNLTQIKSAAEDKIHRLAFYDTLTGLPNRTSFLQSLQEKMELKGEGEKTKPLAVLTLDLDHFKDINDSMGHNVGDEILRAVGKRLRSALPESAVVSRSGEDEFAIAMPLPANATTARDIAERVINVIRSEPFEVFNEQFQVRASVGSATFPKDGHEPDQVLKSADIALNRAKEEGRDSFKEYSEDFDRAVQARFQLLRDLRDALEHNQLTAHYQPQLDLNTGKVIGAEALLRWWKPDNSKEGGSFISPGEFIPVAEQSGLIVPIGEKVLRRACELAKEWNDKYSAGIRIAVNVSGVQFSQSDLVEFTRKTLEETGLEPRFLELEVTESIFMDDINHTIQILKDLHALGIELAIDDFGTGYSSLSYLRQFPIDRLKIDQSFIRNALNNEDDASITKTIIALGQALNLKVIAEGVETKEHEDFLLDQGCDEVQGFRYSRPVPEEDFEKFITTYDGDLSSFTA